jgi:hypothetical protein
MLAILAKPLDWCTIQFARRYVRACPRGTVVPAPTGDAIRQVLTGSGSIGSPADLKMSDDGRFTFASAVKTGAPKNNTVFGRLFRAGENWREKPTVVLLHGWNAELCYRHIFPRMAQRLAEAGLNTAILELPYHMHRRPRTGAVVDFISSDLASMLQATEQAISDTRALCSWLNSQTGRGIGLWGFSLGAWLAGLIMRLEGQVSCGILTTPIANIDRAIGELPFCEPVRPGLEACGTDALRELNLGAQKPLQPPRNVLLVESRHDLFAPAETIEQLWDDWAHPDIWRVAHGHITILMSRRLMIDSVRWLQRRMADR